jgi:hypothetical protein
VARTNVIEVHNTITRDLLDTWDADNAGQLAVDLKGNIWVAPIGPGNIYCDSFNIVYIMQYINCEILYLTVSLIFMLIRQQVLI